MLERQWGGRRFYIFYTLGGAVGALFYLLLVAVHFLAGGAMVGASACILSVLGACAVLFPAFSHPLSLCGTHPVPPCSSRDTTW